MSRRRPSWAALTMLTIGSDPKGRGLSNPEHVAWRARIGYAGYRSTRMLRYRNRLLSIGSGLG